MKKEEVKMEKREYGEEEGIGGEGKGIMNEIGLSGWRSGGECGGYVGVFGIGGGGEKLEKGIENREIGVKIGEGGGY